MCDVIALPLEQFYVKWGESQVAAVQYKNVNQA